MNLKSWRDVIEPNDDVTGGRFEQSEFAADLAQVVSGGGSVEYSDPQKFFSRTYLTGGLKSLLVNVMRRLSLNAGDPIVQLKTSFGGGKTHSLLALYHLFGGGLRAEQSSAVREILNAAEAEFIPRTHTAVVVGSSQNPMRETLWGEIAAQLSASTGKPELYEMMRENDEAGFAPGSALLKKMLDGAGTCLILMDELIAYGRKLREDKVRSRFTVNNFTSFMQELTEAARASDRTALVVTLPASKIETGDEGGEKLLAELEKIFGRVESVWSAATATEGYEIVRRRLFKQCQDTKARNKVCDEFFKMYCERPNNFPSETRQSEYRERLRSCYPIHPQLFDFFYEQWTGLEQFQKTRGILRLMAKVLHHLWMTGDKGAMILPSDIPLDNIQLGNETTVRAELTKLLKGNWGSIVDGDVDGGNSKAYKIDGGRNNFGKLKAAVKISRTIFMGTAPGSRESMVRGLDDKAIRLGTIQPSDAKNIAAFNDALSTLKTSLHYLYAQGDRVWFGVTPTLRKWVADKREKYTVDDVEEVIEKQLESWKQRGTYLNTVHICPRVSNDILDDQTVRLVILPSGLAYVDGIDENAATDAAKKILQTRGSIPRRHQNMLLFMATDAENLKVLDDAAREYMAWRDALNEDLNLDDIRRKDAINNRDTSEKTFKMKVSQAYSKILAPYTDEKNVGDIHWYVENINCTTGDNILAAEKKFLRDERLLPSLGPNALKRFLDEYIWRDKDSVKVDQLGEYFMTYCYLPRLIGPSALFAAINNGKLKKLFVLADNVLYKEPPPVEQVSIEDDIGTIKLVVNLEDTVDVEDEVKIEGADSSESAPEENLPPTHFHMDKELELTRWRKDFTNCAGEIVSHFAGLDGVRIRLSVDIDVPDGISAELEKMIADNCKSIRANCNFD